MNDVKRGHSKLGPAMLLIVLGLLFAAGAGGAATITVDDDGTWADHSSVQDAIDAASAGDTILVYNGTYLEYIVIDVQVDLRGNGSDDTTIDGGGEWEDIVTITAEATSISGFNITGGVMAAGIMAEADMVNITDNLVYDTYYGIKLSEAGNSSVTGNEIFEADYYGLYIYDSDDSDIEENWVHECGDDGVYMSLADSNLLQMNNISDNEGSGIYMSSSDENQFILNRLFDNAEGEVEMGWFCMDNTFVNASVDVSGPLGGAALAEVGETLTLGDFCTKYATGEVTYSWDFDDSDGIQEDSTNASPTWSQATAGTYVVTLTTVADEEFETSDTMSIHVATVDHSEDDDTGDVLDVDGDKVGGHPDIDLTRFVVYLADDLIIVELTVDGAIDLSWEDVTNVYSVYFFHDSDDDITDVDDADYSVYATVDSASIENEMTGHTTDTDFTIVGEDTLMMMVPIDMVGNVTDADMNAVATSITGLSVEGAVIDFTTAPSTGSDGGSSPGMEALMVVAAVAVIVLARKRRN